MKKLTLQLFLSFVCISIYYNAAAVNIVVSRTQMNADPKTGLFGSVSGYNVPVYDAGGNLSWIEQYINCNDPGNQVCPPIILKTVSTGPQFEELVDNPSLQLALKEYAEFAVNSIDNGTINGNEAKTLCVAEADGTNTCYLVTVQWSSNTNGEGTQSDIISLNYNKVLLPAPSN